MEIINHTPFPTLAFKTWDQHRKASQVVVMRATFVIGTDGTLELSGEQEPIATEDEYFGEPNRSSVRQESDLVPFKPRCDVIVNATAHAPGGRPSFEFAAGIRINRTSGENNDMGPPLLEKKLLVTGPRCWDKGFLGSWKLKSPTAPITSLPLRYEHAFGGECRINRDDPDGRRVDMEFRLTREQLNLHPDGPASAPLAHTACGENPFGIGFTEEWYLTVKSIRNIPAPQIDSPESPVTAPCKSYTPQGFGVIAKAWAPRLKLAGTYDDEWLNRRWPSLPEDFDMAYWNGAHPDMQTPYLTGGEMVTLSNLTPDGILVFKLPDGPPTVEVHYADGGRAPVPANLDTLIIEPASMRVGIVWRAVLPTPPEIAAMETRVFSRKPGSETS